MIKDQQTCKVFIFKANGNAWQTATAPLREDAKKFATLAPVVAAAQLRTDFAAGRYSAEEQKYVENFEEINVSHAEVMRSHKEQP